MSDRRQPIRRFPLALTACFAVSLGVMALGPTTVAQPRGTPSYGEVRDVFEANDCIRCHRGSNPAAQLDLGSADAWENLINVRSTQARSLYLVAPGSPDESYLYLKLTNQHRRRGGRGVRMPLGRPRLSEDDLQVVYDWIEGGAPR